MNQIQISNFQNEDGLPRYFLNYLSQDCNSKCMAYKKIFCTVPYYFGLLSFWGVRKINLKFKFSLQFLIMHFIKFSFLRKGFCDRECKKLTYPFTINVLTFFWANLSFKLWKQVG